ncbi:MAG: AAA family ATPase [Lautropia sp.]
MTLRQAKVADLRAMVDSKRGERRVQSGQAQAAPMPSTVGGAALLDLASVEVPYVCRPWIPPGVLIDAGRPKIGKTSRARQKAVHVATGRELWGKPCVKADVLFLSLEEGDRLMGAKLKAAGYSATDLARVCFAFDWPRGTAGAAALDDFVDTNPATRYVVIDSLTRFREAPTREKPQFTQDYEAISALGEVAKQRPGLAIEVIHHTTKALNGSDPISEISGTYGLSAAADSFEVLRKEATDYVVHCGGRYWDEPDDAFRMERDGGRWKLAGVHDGVHLTPMQLEYLRRVVELGTVSNKGLATRLGKAESTTSEIVRELEAKGMLRRTVDGLQATESGSRRASS